MQVATQFSLRALYVYAAYGYIYNNLIFDDKFSFIWA